MKVQVKVKPNSKTAEVIQESDGLVVKVKEPPREGKANPAVIKLLAKYFGVSQSQVKIVAGFRGRSKVVEIAAE